MLIDKITEINGYECIKNKIKQTSLLTIRVELYYAVPSFLTFSGQEQNLGITDDTTVKNVTCFMFFIKPIK